jgi:hypothetical protein
MAYDTGEDEVKDEKKEKPLASDADVSISEELERMKQSKTISFDLISNRVEPFTMELADKFLQMPTFIGERELRDGHVEFLIKEAKRGAFLPEIASLICCECVYDNTLRRLNGQHTCWMRSYMDKSWSPPIRVIKYKVHSEEDFRKLYASIDRGAARSKGHVITSRLFGTKEFDGVTERTIKLVESGYTVYKATSTGKGGHKVNMSADEIADDLMAGSYTLAIKVAKIVGNIIGKEYRFMRRAPVVGAMWATFNKNVGESEAFWDTVKTGVGIDDVDDPRLRLRNFLMRVAVDSGAGSRQDMMAKVSGEDIYRICINMWNAYRKGEMVKVVKTLPTRPSAK